MSLSSTNDKTHTYENVRDRIIQAVKKDPSIKVIGRGTVVVAPSSVISQMEKKAQEVLKK